MLVGSWGRKSRTGHNFHTGKRNCLLRPCSKSTWGNPRALFNKGGKYSPDGKCTPEGRLPTNLSLCSKGNSEVWVECEQDPNQELQGENSLNFPVESFASLPHASGRHRQHWSLMAKRGSQLRSSVEQWALWMQRSWTALSWRTPSRMATAHQRWLWVPVQWACTLTT